jgi:hypothetical protein
LYELIERLRRRPDAAVSDERASCIGGEWRTAWS